MNNESIKKYSENISNRVADVINSKSKLQDETYLALAFLKDNLDNYKIIFSSCEKNYHLHDCIYKEIHDNFENVDMKRIESFLIRRGIFSRKFAVDDAPLWIFFIMTAVNIFLSVIMCLKYVGGSEDRVIMIFISIIASVIIGVVTAVIVESMMGFNWHKR